MTATTTDNWPTLAKDCLTRALDALPLALRLPNKNATILATTTFRRRIAYGLANVVSIALCHGSSRRRIQPPPSSYCGLVESILKRVPYNEK